MVFNLAFMSFRALCDSNSLSSGKGRVSRALRSTEERRPAGRLKAVTARLWAISVLIQPIHNSILLDNQRYSKEKDLEKALDGFPTVQLCEDVGPQFDLILPLGLRLGICREDLLEAEGEELNTIPFVELALELHPVQPERM